jgi:hypothetical protein
MHGKGRAETVALGMTLPWIFMSTVASPILNRVDYEKEQDFLLLQNIHRSVNVSNASAEYSFVATRDGVEVQTRAPMFG